MRICFTSGYIYTVDVDMNSGHVITDRDKTKNHKKLIFNLIKKAQEIDEEKVYYAITDYGYELMDVSEVKDAHIKRIIEKYSSYLLIDSCVMVHREFFGRNANAWARAMAELGVIGYLNKVSDKNNHLVVYDCKAITIVKEEAFKRKEIE